MSKELDGHTKQVNIVVFSLTKSLLLSGSSDLTIKKWNHEKGERLKTLSCGSICLALEVLETEG